MKLSLVSLIRAIYSVLLGSVSLCCSAAEIPQTSQPALFTNAQQILDLGIEKARSTPLPVSISGVLTFPVPGRNWAFVQDETAGILVLYTNAHTRPEYRERVKVTGRVGAGLLSPIITDAALA